MDDLISRQAAVDAADKIIERDTSGNNDVVNAMIAWSEYIRHLPSAQTDVSDTNVGDLVSRTAVIEIFSQLWDCMEEEIIEKEEWEDVCKTTANELPSAQPERKTGKWIVMDDAYNRISGRCSVCGWEAHMYEDDVVGMEYCPNCGAKMETDK